MNLSRRTSGRRGTLAFAFHGAQDPTANESANRTDQEPIGCERESRQPDWAMHACFGYQPGLPPAAFSTEKPSASLATQFSLKDLNASPPATGVSP